MPENARAVELIGVDLVFPTSEGPLKVLDGVDFHAERGESVAVVGPSGSGKSSLLAVAAGLEGASGGEVRLLGETLHGRGEDALARLRRGRVGFVFQSFHLADAMTARENVMTALEIAGRERARTRAEDALAEVGLSGRLTHYPHQLSGGERQRVAVARALAIDPEIVFADEPTGNLDAKAGGRTADLLFALTKDRGASLILVTHDEALAGRADRIVRMADGRVAEGAAFEEAQG